jgi:HD-like signal output (HDOD) protein
MFSQFWRRLTGTPGASTSTAAAPTSGPAEPAATPAPVREVAPKGEIRVATEESLRRSLTWRSRVLMEGAGEDIMRSDGPALVAALTDANESVIRQPPAAAQRALRVASNPETPMPKVVELFENDPMLAQALLRFSNSVFYRRDSQPTASLQSAVQRVGMNGVQTVLTASLVQTMLCRPGGAYDALVQKVWTHMQRSAPIARTLAPAFGLDAETMFSLALLHDVGKLVIFDHISTLRHDKRRDLKMPDLFFRQMLWHLHEPIGGLSVLHWGMGGEAAHAVAEHHRRPAPDTPDTVTECLFVAESIELAQTNFAKLDWEAVWKNGAVTTEMGSVQERMRKTDE